MARNNRRKGKQQHGGRLTPTSVESSPSSSSPDMGGTETAPTKEDDERSTEETRKGNDGDEEKDQQQSRTTTMDGDDDEEEKDSVSNDNSDPSKSSNKQEDKEHGDDSNNNDDDGDDKKNAGSDGGEGRDESGVEVTTDMKKEGGQEKEGSSSDDKYNTSDKNDKNSKNDDVEEQPLVLTSAKRRGVYECDYCHADISQQPRIRCAVCPDFDLCLDCFTTTDHEAAVTRLKAAAETHSELKKDGVHTVQHDPSQPDDGTRPSVVLTSAALTHEAWHGYKVCDSTRYPVFATGRVGGAGGGGGSGIVSIFTDGNGSSTTFGDSSDKMSSADGDAEMIDMDNVNDDDGVEGRQKPSNKSFMASRDVMEIAVLDDSKVSWTAEEDLRLLEAIKTHGLGNWVDISESISGNGSSGKTPKRCMERYFDDFLGRYGCIFPKYTIVDEELLVKSGFSTTTSYEDAEPMADSTDGRSEMESNDEKQSTIAATPSTPTPVSAATREEEGTRSSKRKSAASRLTPSILAAASRGSGSYATRKKMRVVPTDLLPEAKKLWPRPYLPAIEGVQMGQEVARDLSIKAEQAFVKATIAANTREEADKIREEYIAKYKVDPIGAPTVLPPRPDDAAYLPGAELAGYMPRRGDFDIEWDNSAENAIADMEFSRTDTPQDKKLKLQVLDIYCRKLDEREKRKNFILTRHLYDYRKYIQDNQKLPADERDLIHRMRLFERFHTTEEHQKFIEDLLKAKRLRKEIAKLQMYRRIGIRSLAEAEKYELDKQRRQFHKMSLAQREQEAKARIAAKQAAAGNSRPSAASAAAASGVSANVIANQIASTDSLWKQYRNNDRKFRRSSSRSSTSTIESQIPIPSIPGKKPPPADNNNAAMTAPAASEVSLKTIPPPPPAGETPSAMDVDKEGPTTAPVDKDVDEEGKKNSNENESDLHQTKMSSAENPIAAPSKDQPSNTNEKASNADDEATWKTQTPSNTDSGVKPMDVVDDDDNDAKQNVAEKQQGEVKEEKQGVDVEPKKTTQDNTEEGEGNKQEEFDASRAKGHELLSKNEIALCNRLMIYPMQYLPVKKALIQESFNNGLLDKSSSSRRTVCKIDITKRGTVVDFLIRAGWVDSKLKHAAMSADPSGFEGKDEAGLKVS